MKRNFFVRYACLFTLIVSLLFTACTSQDVGEVEDSPTNQILEDDTDQVLNEDATSEQDVAATAASTPEITPTLDLGDLSTDSTATEEEKDTEGQEGTIDGENTSDSGNEAAQGDSATEVEKPTGSVEEITPEESTSPTESINLQADDLQESAPAEDNSNTEGEALLNNGEVALYATAEAIPAVEASAGEEVATTAEVSPTAQIETPTPTPVNVDVTQYPNVTPIPEKKFLIKEFINKVKAYEISFQLVSFILGILCSLIIFLIILVIRRIIIKSKRF